MSLQVLTRKTREMALQGCQSRFSTCLSVLPGLFTATFHRQLKVSANLTSTMIFSKKAVRKRMSVETKKEQSYSFYSILETMTYFHLYSGAISSEF